MRKVNMVYSCLGVFLFSLLHFSSALDNSTYYSHDDVLLVCNPASSESMNICSYFLSKRPTLHRVINLSSIPAQEVIDCSVYDNLEKQIREYLNYTNDVNYIVTTKGVPLLRECSGQKILYGKSVDSMLAANLKGNISTNEYVGSEEAFSSAKQGFYIVTRLAGYTFDDIKNLIDRSDISNLDPAALMAGKFVLDESRRDFTTYFLQTESLLRSKGYNVIYQNATKEDIFIRNETDVIGYSSWGSNDPTYLNNVLLNGDFSSWESDIQPAFWNISSGEMYKTTFLANPGSMNSTSAGLINQSGIFEMHQTYSSPLAAERRFYNSFDYAYRNFSGSAMIGLNSFDATGNLISSSNEIIFSAASAAGGYLVSSSTLRYNPLSNIQRIELFVIVNLTQGEFYIDNMRFYEISPTFTWKNGAIGTTAVSTSARSFSNRTSYGQSLIADLIHNGISGVEGFVDEPYLPAIANTAILFDRYTKGYNLGDSFYMASDNRNWMDVIIGDPKTVIVLGQNLTFPKNDSLSCNNINVSGVYTQTENLSTCINITVSDVTYNGNGYWISNASLKAAGIYASHVRNITILNVKVMMNYSRGYGIYFYDVNDSRISDTFVSGNNIGLRLFESNNNKLIRNIAINNSDGIVVEGLRCFYNTVTNNTANNNNNGIIFSGNCSYNNLTNNTANNNSNGIAFYYSCYDECSSNILSMNTANNNVNGIIMGSIGAKSAARMILSSNNVNSNLNVGISLDSIANSSIISNKANYNYYGIVDSDSFNNTFRNNIAQNNNYGFSLFSTRKNTLVKNTANFNKISGFFDSGINNSLSNNIANNNAKWGFALFGSTFARIINNSISFNGDNSVHRGGIIVAGNSNNNLIESNILNNNYHGIVITAQAEGFERSRNVNLFSNKFIGGSITSSKNDAIFIDKICSSGCSSQLSNNITNIRILKTNASYHDLNVSSGVLTNGLYLIDQKINKYTILNSGNISIKSSLYGEIRFLNLINESGVNLNKDVQVSYNLAYINASRSSLNKSAIISLYHLPGNKEKTILRDGVICNSTTPIACINLTLLNESNIVFSVSQGGKYIANYSLINQRQRVESCFFACKVLPNGTLDCPDIQGCQNNPYFPIINTSKKS